MLAPNNTLIIAKNYIQVRVFNNQLIFIKKTGNKQDLKSNLKEIVITAKDNKLIIMYNIFSIININK